MTLSLHAANLIDAAMTTLSDALNDRSTDCSWSYDRNLPISKLRRAKGDDRDAVASGYDYPPARLRATVAAPPTTLPTMSISPTAAAYPDPSADMFALKRPRFPLLLPIARSAAKVVELDGEQDAVLEAKQPSAEMVPAEDVDPDVIVEEGGTGDKAMASDDTEDDRRRQASNSDVSDTETIIYRQTETMTVFA